MHNMKPLTPLGADMPRVDTLNGLTITERTDRALASVAARNGHGNATREAAAAHLGFALADVGQCAGNETFSAWWMGPDLWMVDAPHETHENLAHDLKAAVGASASVAEQTDGWCRFDLSGPLCAAVFERLCNIDIRATTAGDALRTSIEHLGCFVLCVEARTDYAVLGPRSSAGSLHHALLAAAKSVVVTGDENL